MASGRSLINLLLICVAVCLVINLCLSDEFRSKRQSSSLDYFYKQQLQNPTRTRNDQIIPTATPRQYDNRFSNSDANNRDNSDSDNNNRYRDRNRDPAGSNQYQNRDQHLRYPSATDDRNNEGNRDSSNNRYNTRNDGSNSQRDNLDPYYRQPSSYDRQQPRPDHYDPQYDYQNNRYFRKEYNPYDFNEADPAKEYAFRRQKKMDATIPPVNVNTAFGTVSGYKVFLYDGPQVPIDDRPGHKTFDKVYRNVTVFKGIPYAEPPVYDRRFKKPEPLIRNWGSIDGREFKPACPQHNDYIGLVHGIREVSEDCLYLNVYTPSARKRIRHLYPVMIYIHGGFFKYGSASRFPAHMLSGSNDVVVVTFNYRLGVLGFLSTGDIISPGNYGLLDQVMAIKWVSNNIRYFNGDPVRITLFGPGAGAASAGLHTLSPLTQNLIHRVIAQSGSMLAEWAVTVDREFSRNTTRLFGEAVGCRSTSSQSLVECLRSRSYTELVNANFKPMVGWLAFTPVVDWYTQEQGFQFLKDAPERLLDEGGADMTSPLQYLTGLTTDEAVAIILKNKELKSNNYVIDKKYFNKRVREYIDMYNYTLNPNGVYNAIKFMYTDWADPENTTLIREQLIQMLSDSYFVAPAVKLNNLLLKNNIRPYMYVLNTTVESVKQPLWHGVPHDTEYLYLTGAPFMDPEFYPKEFELEGVTWTDRDRNMSEFTMRTFTNFARDGNPSLPKKVFNIKWEPMSVGNLQYLSLNTTNDTYSIMERDYRKREAAFWTEYIPQLIGREIPTWPPFEEPWHEERRVIRAALWGTVAVAILLLILMLVCCVLYCSKKRHLVDSEQIPRLSSPYTIGAKKPKYFTDEVTVNHQALKSENQTSV